MSTQRRRVWARLQKGVPSRGGARLLVIAAALAGVFAAAPAASLFAPSAHAASPAPLSTFLPERALPAAAPGDAAALEGALQSGVARLVPKPGSGRWYWPTGAENFGGYSGFLDPRGAYFHVAQDMHSPQGRPVYAIGAGTVWISRADTGGYGVDGAPGGCMIIVHRTAAGEELRALYGHISGLKYKAGERVAAGAVIATINGCDHLHFGIHPSAVYRDGNPYAGHVPKSWKDYGGWVDPVKYLKSHPRGASYEPPSLPLAKVATELAPHDFGAVAGFAYWAERAAGTEATYAFDLATGTRRAMAADETRPPFDKVRYTVKALAAPAVGFSVRDRQPVLVLEALPDLPPWGSPVQITAKLTNAAGKGFGYAQVQLERLDGAAWTMVELGRTATDGTHVFTVSPATRTVFRAQFLLPASQPENATYTAPESPVATVVPKVRISTPVLPKAVARAAQVTLGGSLAPRHPAGTGSVVLEFQRHTVDGLWVAAKTTKATLSDVAAGSAYSCVVKLTKAGAWRVRAVHPDDAAHAESASSWRALTVK